MSRTSAFSVDLYPCPVRSDHLGSLDPLFDDIIQGCCFVRKTGKQAVYTALADIDVEYIVQHFPHSLEGQVLSCMEVTDQPFGIVPISHWRIHSFGEVRNSTATTATLADIGAVLRTNSLYRWDIHNLPRTFPYQGYVLKRCTATTTIVGAKFNDVVRRGSYLKGAALMTMLATGLSSRRLSKTLVLLGAVHVARRRHGTVAAVLGILVLGKAFAKERHFFGKLVHLFR